MDNIIKSIDAGITSTETGIELNPLIKDHALEKKRLEDEKAERMEQQQSIFEDGDGSGAQSFSDGNEDKDKEDEE